MITCTFDIVGSSPISFGRPVQSIKKTGEKHDDFEHRTWRERVHVDGKDIAFIPPMALKNCLTDVAQYLSETIPGKGKATFTKKFKAGVMVIDPMDLGVKLADIEGERIFVPSDGKRGGGSRVWKTFPVIRNWTVEATAYIADPAIKPAKMLEYLTHAGKFIGLGRFRPINNGFYGRFTIENFEAIEED